MKRPGLDKARKRLAEAFASVEQLERATAWEDFEAGWSRFLSAINATYNILGASSRGEPKSEGWFSKIQGLRRSDDLLGYLMHARNSNDHGIDSVLERKPGGLGIGKGAREVHIEKLVVEKGKITTLRGSQDGGPLRVEIIPERIELRPVIDRGVEYAPPTSFLGKEIPDRSPAAVGKVGLEFIARLFAEAEELLAAANR